MGDELEDDAYAELADLILNVSRLIRVRTPTGPGVVALTPTERQVMRVVDLFPGSSPTEIAERTQLQRTNVSTALRGLADKGMIVRSSAGGRSVSVEPTDLAVSNLRVLKTGWAWQLAEALPVDPASIRRCNELLSQLELNLTAGDHD